MLLSGENDMKKMFFILMCLILIQTNFCFSINENKDSDENSTKPLSLIFPKNETTSNPPFLHWIPLENAEYYKIKIHNEKDNWQFISKYNFYTPMVFLHDSESPFSITITAFNKDKEVIQTSKEMKFYNHINGLYLPHGLNDITFPKGNPILFTPEMIEEIRNAKGNEMAKYRDALIEYANSPQHELIKNLKEPDRYKNNIWEISQWQHKNDVAFSIRDYLITRSLAYVITKDKKYYNAAKDVMLKVSDWNPSGGTGLYDDDHAAQSILYSFSVSYNLLQNEFSPEERGKIKRCIIQRAEDVYSFLNPFGIKKSIIGGFTDPTNNHPWFCTEALGYAGLALMGEDQRAEEWLSFAAQIFWGIYLSCGGKNGDWHEGIDYWSYTLFFVFHFCDGLKTAADINFYMHPWLKNTALYKIYTHPPKGGYVPFGDCKHQDVNAFDKLVMMRLASKFNDPLYWKYVDSIPGEIKGGYLSDALLWSERKTTSIDIFRQFPFAINFEDSGWVVSNNDVFSTPTQIIFAFRCGKVFGNGGHSHPDQNSFIITAGGDKLIWDIGYYDYYGSPHHSNFSATTRAHNVILVDGEGQKRRLPKADGILKEFKLDGKKLFIQGDASNPLIYDKKIKTFLRSIKYENEKDFIIIDEIELNNPGNISWLLNSDFPIKFEQKDKTISIKGKTYQIIGKFMCDEELEVSFLDKFSDEPKRDKYHAYPNQYGIELKTKNKILKWNPQINLSLSKINE